MKELLKINNLHVTTGDKQILKGVELEVKEGEIHVIMGPNGAGKSTLANAIMSHPNYQITSGNIMFENQDITNVRTDEKAKKGIFLSFQHPEEIPGISVENFLRTIKTSIDGKKQSVLAFRKILDEKLKLLKIDPSYTKRYLNVGFSGGEKKKSEILQMAILNPKLAILDETDSGLDVDAIKIVANGVKILENEKQAIIVITHQSKLLEYLKPDFVHIMIDGKIVKTGKAELIEEIQKDGYEKYRI